MSTSYFIEQYLQHAGWPKYNRLNNTYNACCPICREGSSWGKKKRSYFLVDKNMMCCHNCGWYGSAVKWVMQVVGLSYDEVMGNVSVVDVDKKQVANGVNVQVDMLPTDAINLYEPNQVKYWRDNSIVKQAIRYIVSRRLHTACNKPNALYISLVDRGHKNRICIPFTHNNIVVHYQTRGLLYKDLQERPKYLSKINSDKTLFNIDNVNVDSSNMYIVEGPIDSFFIKDSVAVAGIQSNSKSQFSSKQLSQLREYIFHKKVWCLDSQQQDKTSLEKTRMLIEAGETVFIWPDELGNKYKDYNDYCVGEQVDCFPETIINDNTYVGERASLRLSSIELKLRGTSGLGILSSFTFSS